MENSLNFGGSDRGVHDGLQATGVAKCRKLPLTESPWGADRAPVN